MRIRMFGWVAALVLGATGVLAADGPRVLLFSKSAGYEHDVIKVKDGAPNHVETVVRPLIEGIGGTLVASKDGAHISPDGLKQFDVVIFYTTEDLCLAECPDGSPPVGEDGMMALIDWVKAGGGFVGFHCASDTWHRARNQFSPESPYLDMVGGEFRGHGAQFIGTLRVVDPDHPTMANVKDGWRINDEWYLFSDLQDRTIHTLALLDPAEERANQEKYQVPAYPVIWCSAPGEGRVFYNAMGHRDDVWTDPTFQQLFLDTVNWANGEGEADAEPNWAEVVPAELDAKTGANK